MSIKEKMLNWADQNPDKKSLELNLEQFTEYKTLLPKAMIQMRMYQFMSRDNRPIRVYYKKDANEI